MYFFYTRWVGAADPEGPRVHGSLPLLSQCCSPGSERAFLTENWDQASPEASFEHLDQTFLLCWDRHWLEVTIGCLGSCCPTGELGPPSLGRGSAGTHGAHQLPQQQLRATTTGRIQTQRQTRAGVITMVTTYRFWGSHLGFECKMTVLQHTRGGTALLRPWHRPCVFTGVTDLSLALPFPMLLPALQDITKAITLRTCPVFCDISLKCFAVTSNTHMKKIIMKLSNYIALYILKSLYKHYLNKAR